MSLPYLSSKSSTSFCFFLEIRDGEDSQLEMRLIAFRQLTNMSNTCDVRSNWVGQNRETDEEQVDKDSEGDREALGVGYQFLYQYYQLFTLLPKLERKVALKDSAF